MTTDTAKQYFDFCDRAYQEQADRTAFPLPEWIRGLRSESESARVAHVCLQAALVAMLKNPGAGDRLVGLRLDGDMTPASYVNTLAVVRKMNGQQSHEPLVEVLQGLSDYLRYATDLGALPLGHEVPSEAGLLHALATEAAGRNAAAVTPAEVTRFMYRLADSVMVHAYAQDGLGLLYGLEADKAIWAVGDELRSGGGYVLPPLLASTYEESRVLFQAPSFANRAFLDLEQMVRHEKPQAEALLVNASRWHVPFYPAGDDDRPAADAGGLNHCLQAGYSRVVVVLSNHALTAGRGRASRILQYLLRQGLQQVIQLPMGVLGLRSQAHSILVFGKGPNTGEVEFATLSEQNASNAPKGFGQPRRARRLFAGEQISHEQTVREDVSALLARNSSHGRAKASKLLSFEAGQFAKEDPFESLRSRYAFMRLGAFMDVFRSHHIVEKGNTDRAAYNEIGAVNITPEGSVLLGRAKDCPSESLRQRQAQVLCDEDVIVCFRGAPDSFGKVGMYRHKEGVTAVPNQSFVIVRRKPDAPDGAPSAAHVLWWLKSIYAQRYLQKKAIAPDVMRITPRDIGAIEVPCGPTALMHAEAQKLYRAEQAIKKINELREEVATLLSRAWQ